MNKRKILLLLACCVSVCICAQDVTEFEFYDTASPALLKIMQDNVNEVFKSINKSYSDGNAGLSGISTNHATDAAIGQIRSLWETSRFYCAKTYVLQPVLRTSKGLQVRNIPVFFEQGETDEDRNQDLVIEFGDNGKISDVYISIWKHQYMKFFEGATSVTDYRCRQMAVQFVEHFRTAYNKKDLAYLENVFSDDALIIVGREVRSNGDGWKPANVTYDELSKHEYMRRLKAAFLKNAYINIKFSEIEVVQQDKSIPVYGVTLRQDWNASEYSDVGWLFLIIDFKDENRPLIWVRTWQPISVPRNKVFSAGDFPMISSK